MNAPSDLPIDVADGRGWLDRAFPVLVAGLLLLGAYATLYVRPPLIDRAAPR